MKKLIILFITVIFTLSLASCTDAGEIHFYNSIVRDIDAGMDLSEVIKSISAESGRMLIIYGEGTPRADGELVFGETRRAVSIDAKRILSEKMRSASGACGYLIYKSEDGSVGTVWTDVFGMEAAIERFAADYCNLGELEKMPAGILAFEDFTPEGYYPEN